MTTSWEPARVPPALVDLTRRLGDPAADLVVVAEGNTSVRLPDGTFAVKASGSQMAHAVAEDFVVVEPGALLELLDRPDARQEDLTALLTARASGAAPADSAAVPRRASIETLVHLAALEYGGATWVAHTHPPPLVGLLSVADAAELWAAPLFPDEAVMLGPPAWVPYAEPGLRLGHEVVASVHRHSDRFGAPPRLILLGNHGIVALGDSAQEAEAVTRMAVKAAQVRSVALATGRALRSLPHDHALRLAGRTDEADRRTLLRGGAS